MREQSADVRARELREAGVARLVRHQRRALLPEGLVRVHARAVVAEDRLRHERHRLAGRMRDVLDHVLVGHDLIAPCESAAGSGGRSRTARRTRPRGGGTRTGCRGVRASAPCACADRGACRAGRAGSSPPSRAPCSRAPACRSSSGPRPSRPSSASGWGRARTRPRRRRRTRTPGPCTPCRRCPSRAGTPRRASRAGADPWRRARA